MTVHTTGYGGGYGNSIIWTSCDGREKLHLAHLSVIGKTGAVKAGDLIGRVGHTGAASGDHLHMARSYDGRVAPIVLSGQEIAPAWTYIQSEFDVSPYTIGRSRKVLISPAPVRRTGNPIGATRRLLAC